ncbi:hypothetical protein UY416_19505 [Paenibacillus polymyxa]|uniref:hypothetical protein n=1 Tax=Paenibacillus polymyxa TaxID=1406 RepID=UPI002AB5D907|nr:hypothetical protein [Paenibacillus polymyxa]MDY8048481.1 hypothetical protein [Paenibacillus polymyxa]
MATIIAATPVNSRVVNVIGAAVEIAPPAPATPQESSQSKKIDRLKRIFGL